MFLKSDQPTQSERIKAAASRSMVMEIAALHRLNKLGDENPAPGLLDAQFMPDPRDKNRRIAVVVMEYVDGVTLDKFADDHKEDPLEIVDALQKTVDGLELAHAIGIIHSDIKNNNIMVDETGKVKLIDFGTAFIPQLAKKQAASHTGAVYGQAAYEPMSSKHFAPPDKEIASRARDRYSLGRTIQFAVFGREEFQDPTKMSEIEPSLSYPYRELAEIAKQLVRTEPDQRISLPRVQRLLKHLTATENGIANVKKQLVDEIAA